MKLILASTSPYRRALLQRLTQNFTCQSPGVDEDQFKLKGLSPTILAQTLAQEKARAVFSREPDSFVIGGDQLVELDGEILGKPGNETQALTQLQKMRGKTHRLLTAVHLIGPNHEAIHLNVTELEMRIHSDNELLTYLKMDQPFDCAGSYKIEEHGIKLFSAIRTEDMNAITGLPLIWLQTALLKAGFSFFP